MTSVSNVKGQKRVCKFKYESQQHLSFPSFPPLSCLYLFPPLLSLAHSQHATWGQVEYAAQTLLQFEAVARPAATCAAWQGETDWPQLPLPLPHTPLLSSPLSFFSSLLSASLPTRSRVDVVALFEIYLSFT